MIPVSRIRILDMWGSNFAFSHWGIGPPSQRAVIAKILRVMVRARDMVRVRVFHGSFWAQQLGLLPVMVIEFGTAVYRIA